MPPLSERFLQPVAAQLTGPLHLLAQAVDDLDRNDHQKGTDVVGQEAPDEIEGAQINRYAS